MEEGVQNFADIICVLPLMCRLGAFAQPPTFMATIAKPYRGLFRQAETRFEVLLKIRTVEAQVKLMLPVETENYTQKDSCKVVTYF